MLHLLHGRQQTEKHTCIHAGNPNVLVCERGTMFGYSDLVVDPRNFVLMRDAGCPVTADVTHALQQPAGGCPVRQAAALARLQCTIQ